MTKYPLEWGWDPSDTSSSSTAPDWKPTATLLGSDGSHSSDKIEVAQLKCEGPANGNGCLNRGTYGATAMYGVRGRKLCQECAARETGAAQEPADEKVKILTPFLLK